MGAVLELIEASLEHELRTDSFYLHQIEYHIIAEMERRIESVSLSLDHSLRRYRLKFLVAHDDDNTTVIQPTTTRTTGHLDILARGQVAEVAPVELARGCEDDGLGGHVEPDGERLSREKDFDEPLLEEDLDDFFEDGQETAVVDPNAAFEQW